MNKPLIITIAIGVLVLALGSWVYLFLFGTPQSSEDVFTDLGIMPGQQVDNPIPTPEETGVELPTVDTTAAALRQLTLRPVAGHFFNAVADTVRYVEQGTGHVYEINLASGAEERISNTTIPRTQMAVFNTLGTQVVMSGESTVVGTIENGGLTFNELPPAAANLQFTGSTTVLYTLVTQGGTIGYIYNSETNSQREDFVVPFGTITVQQPSDETYLYTDPAVELEGALFSMVEQTVSQVGSSEFGLVADVGEQWYAISFNLDDELLSRAVSLTDASLAEVPVPVVPEKCDWLAETLYCAAPVGSVLHTYIENWYKGLLRSNDALWQIDPLNEVATLLVNPPSAVGRPLDITNLLVTEDVLLFINRLDNSLWLYDLASS